MSNSKKIKVVEIADYFIYKANKDSKTITNKKLQKLVYYSQAWNLALNNEKLFSDKIEAWIHGPAIRSIYKKYKIFGFNPISKKITKKSIENIPKKTRDFLDEVWKVYGKLDAGYLEFLTHSEEPWQKAREGLQGCENSENEILPQMMKDFYSKKLKNA